MANITLFSNASAMPDLPPLPSYTLTPLKPLVPFIPDIWLSLILTFVAYWAVSLFFHFIDVYDIFPQYRLHTPAEILNRNHVSRYEVARDVIIQQAIQTVVGVSLGLTEPPEMVGKENYDIAVWATRLRIAQRALPQLLGLVGLNATAISKNLAGSHPMLAGALAGGRYPSLSMGLDVVSGAPIPAFASWEMFAASAIYWYIVPIIQFAAAIIFVDTWQYFLHRAMHMNKWLYSKLKPLPFRLSGLTNPQQLSTPDITACTFPTRMELCTTIRLKDSSSTPSEQA
jgi:sphinganine C4-monooxygenase